jgi:hypothetical protein
MYSIRSISSFCPVVTDSNREVVRVGRLLARLTAPFFPIIAASPQIIHAEQLYPGIVSSVLLGGDPLPVADFVADYFERVAVQLPVLPRPESVPFMESPSAVPV